MHSHSHPPFVTIYVITEECQWKSSFLLDVVVSLCTIRHYVVRTPSRFSFYIVPLYVSRLSIAHKPVLTLHIPMYFLQGGFFRHVRSGNSDSSWMSPCGVQLVLLKVYWVAVLSFPQLLRLEECVFGWTIFVATQTRVDYPMFVC
jgi:hypothetical protein